MEANGSLGSAVEEMAHGEWFDRGLCQLPRAAQVSRDARQVHLRGVRLKMRFEQPEAALVSPGRAQEPASRERCRGDASDASPTRMEALGPSSLLQKDLHAARCRRSDALRAHKRVAIETKQTSRHQGSAEMGDDAGGMETH